MDDAGPFLASVVFCRSIDDRPDRVTYHGVLDAFDVEVSPRHQPRFEVVKLVVKVTGRQPAHGWHLTVDVAWPDARQERVADGRFPPSASEVVPATAIYEVDIPTEHAGVAWFDVAINDDRLTRVPFWIKHYHVGFPA